MHETNLRVAIWLAIVVLLAATVQAEPPRLLVAPFDAKQARAGQEAWAKHLGVPVVQKNSLGMSLTLIPPGEFRMGGGETSADLEQDFKLYIGFYNDDERPVHRVRITRPFYLCTHEITIGQFRQFVRDAGYQTDAEKSSDGGWGRNPETNYFARAHSIGSPPRAWNRWMSCR